MKPLVDGAIDQDPHRSAGGWAVWELATAEYLEWFNSARLHSAIGHVPPAEYEAAHYAQTQPQPVAGANT